MDLLEATDAVLVLVNTRPVGRRPDGLNRWSDLGPLFAELATHRPTGNPPPADDATAGIAEARHLREALTAVVLADSPTRAAQRLEELAAAHGTVDHTPGGHHRPNLVPGRGSPVAELAAAVTPLLHQAVAAGVLERIGVCPDALCRTVFLDRSPARRRRYCSPRCATRARMHRHRQQHPPVGRNPFTPG
ncbi:CGNR zinc finger domain-containing protein [Kocuria sp.]|uniref:CGNR zinc finger domain-containing protein n=1 Tax=Kocuria sp. TaxID=1871328 RepID=UPI002810BBA6|nr:CGNR zinc finger domain-containing protein [Kocuria sp.]